MTCLPVIMTAVFIALTFPAYGQLKFSDEHLKKSNPDELYFSLFVGPFCPEKQEAYEELVEGEFLRARIKRVPYWEYGVVHLVVLLDCMLLENSQQSVIWTYNIYYAVKQEVENPGTDGYPFITMFYGDDLFNGNFGIAPSNKAEQQIKTSLRDDIPSALTDYLKANFSRD